MIEKRVQGYIRKHHMIETGDRVLIGLSGGADSAALFHILRRSCSKLGFELLAVHVDHGLRGMEARRDRKFVEDLCRQYQIPCQCEEMPVRDMAAQKRLSLEEAGRRRAGRHFGNGAGSGAAINWPWPITRMTRRRPCSITWPGGRG